MPFESYDVVPRLMDHVRSTWPYLNRSVRPQRQSAAARRAPSRGQNRVTGHPAHPGRAPGAQMESGFVNHFITLTCDHGPGDCEYMERPLMRSSPRAPSWWNAADPGRAVGFIMWNGMRDGPDAGQQECLVCFQRGKDIQMATAENVCGPLCGYSRQVLANTSVWANSTLPAPQRGESLAKHAALMQFLHPKAAQDRKNVMFYGGNIHVSNGERDNSGRAQMWMHHGNRSGWVIHNTFVQNTDVASPLRQKISFAEQMSDSMFCYSPLGQFGGDTDRYIPAMLFGCIPVMLASLSPNSGRAGGRHVPMALPLEEHPAVGGWTDFAILVDMDDLGSLHHRLAALSAADIRRLRAGLARVWRRFLWTGLYGSYLGEGPDQDAFETLVGVFRQRLLSAGRLSAAEAAEAEPAALPQGGT